MLPYAFIIYFFIYLILFIWFLDKSNSSLVCVIPNKNADIIDSF